MKEVKTQEWLELKTRLINDENIKCDLLGYWKSPSTITKKYRVLFKIKKHCYYHFLNLKEIPVFEQFVKEMKQTVESNKHHVYEFSKNKIYYDLRETNLIKIY